MTPRHSRTLPTRTLLAAAACLAVAGTLAGCGSDDSPDEAAETPAATPTSPSPGSEAPTSSEPSASPTQEAPLIAYAGGESPGAEGRQPADADKLEGAPESFRTFLADAVRRLVANSTCTDGYVGITVEFLRTDGYAVGGVNDCGGYAALWAVVDGQWKEIAGTQEAWDCAVLERYAVPSDVAGTTCYDYAAQEGRAYRAS
jgi:hypothetical protein